MKDFNIKEVKVKDLDGNILKVEGLGKTLGNTIYKNTATIEWLDKAKAIHQETPVALTHLELSELQQIIDSPSCTLILAIKEAIRLYIETLKK